MVNTASENFFKESKRIFEVTQKSVLYFAFLEKGWGHGGREKPLFPGKEVFPFPRQLSPVAAESAAADGEKFDVKDQRGVGRDIVARAVGAVAEAGGDEQAVFCTGFH